MSKNSKIPSIFLMGILAIGMLPLFYFVSVEIGVAEASVGTLEVEEDSKDTFGRYIDNVSFGTNEMLKFDINYGFINAGTATMEVLNLIEYENRPCYQILTTATSNSFFSSFYKVEDSVESIVDAVGMFSWHFKKKLREGKYKSDRKYSFDQRNNQVIYNEDTIAVPSFVQDVLSLMYYIRTQELTPDKSIFADNFTDGKHYSIEVKVIKRERITVEAGTFDCILVEPLLQSVGVFKHEGKLSVWLTDDRLKMPVLMKSKVLVGSISAELTEYILGEIESF